MEKFCRFFFQKKCWKVIKNFSKLSGNFQQIYRCMFSSLTEDNVAYYGERCPDLSLDNSQSHIIVVSYPPWGTVVTTIVNCMVYLNIVQTSDTKSSHHKGKKNKTCFSFFLGIYMRWQMLTKHCGNGFTIYVSHIVTLYTLKSCSAVHQLDFSKLDKPNPVNKNWQKPVGPQEVLEGRAKYVMWAKPGSCVLNHSL